MDTVAHRIHRPRFYRVILHHSTPYTIHNTPYTNTPYTIHYRIYTHTSIYPPTSAPAPASHQPEAVVDSSHRRQHLCSTLELSLRLNPTASPSAHRSAGHSPHYSFLGHPRPSKPQSPHRVGSLCRYISHLRIQGYQTQLRSISTRTFTVPITAARLYYCSETHRTSSCTRPQVISHFFSCAALRR